MSAGYFLIQLASEEDKEKVYKEIGEKIRKDADGVKQVRLTFFSSHSTDSGGYRSRSSASLTL